MVAAALSFLLAACGAPGTYYEKSPENVRKSLKSARLPYHILGSTAAGSSVKTPDDQTVITTILDKNRSELMRFVTTITPEGTGSRVNTVIAPPEGANAERAQKAMQENGFATVMLDKLAAEHVAAAVEGRPFDMMFATPAMAKGMINANPEMRAAMNEANASAAAMNEAVEAADNRPAIYRETTQFGQPTAPIGDSNPRY